MHLSPLALTIGLASTLVNAAIFPKDSKVTMLGPKEFKQVMKLNQTSLVAFVAPWCGHCQRMAPEYAKAAKGLNPLIPTYAIDCDAEPNKRLCAEQDVKGFPTVKLFPRGSSLPPMTYEQERTAGGFYNFAARRVPKAVTALPSLHEITSWVAKHPRKHRALLLTKDPSKKVPLLWKVLGNKYKGMNLEFGAHADLEGKTSVEMGYEKGAEKASKVLLYPAGQDKPRRYIGVTKLENLSNFFDRILSTDDLPEAEMEPEQSEPAKKATEDLPKDEL